MPDLSIETQLLRAPLARHYAPTTERAADLAPLFARTDWDRFTWLGQLHCVLVAWQRALSENERALVPTAIQAQIQSLAEANQLQVLTRARECCRLQDLFAEHNLAAIALSGWALAQRHHAQPLHREIEAATAFHVRAIDRPRGEALLEASGYPRRDPLRLLRRHRSVVALLPPFLLDGAPGEAEASLVWPETESWQFGGRTFRLLHPRDWLLRLCARGHDHLWQRLHRVVDLAEMLRTHPATDWPATWARALQLRLERALLVGVGTTCHAWGCDLPPFLASQLSRHPEGAFAAATLADRLRGGTVEPLPETATRRLRAAMGFATGTASAVAPRPSDHGSLGRYSPTPDALARRMLELASVGPGDVVYDLGCGDGRLVLAAAQQFGARAVGVDIDPRRIAEAEARAAAEAVADRVRFVCADLRKIPIGEATVVCLYLQDFAYGLLRRKLEAELRPGTRIVSHRFAFEGWVPEKCRLVRTEPDIVAPIHLWRVGAVTQAGAGISAQ